MNFHDERDNLRSAARRLNLVSRRPRGQQADASVEAKVWTMRKIRAAADEQERRRRAGQRQLHLPEERKTARRFGPPCR